MPGGFAGAIGAGAGGRVLTSGSNLTRACSARARRAWLASLAHAPALSLGGVLLMSSLVSPRCRFVSHWPAALRWSSGPSSPPWNRAGGLGGSESIIIGEGLRGGGARRVISSKDSMPGRRMGCDCWLPEFGGGSVTVSGGNCDGVMTWLSLLAPLYSRVSGCQVRLRHPSSTTEDIESRLDQVDVDAVGDANKLPCDGENAPALDELNAEGPKRGPLRPGPCGDWNGLPPDGTLSRRPGVLEPVYML